MRRFKRMTDGIPYCETRVSNDCPTPDMRVLAPLPCRYPAVLGSLQVSMMKAHQTATPQSTMIKTRYQRIHTLSLADIARMHELFEAHYACSPYATFLRDLQAKEGAFIVRRKDSDEIVGFSTLAVTWLEMGGRRVKGLFSGDTIMERAYWGSRSLQLAFCKKLFWEALRAPLTPQYWLLICKGYKTYLLLARNFSEYYPRLGVEQPEMRDLVSDYCEALFPGKRNSHTGLLEFGDDANRLHGDVAEITPQMLAKDPDIRFFETLNPSWRQGTELPCIARTDLGAFLRTLGPFLLKIARQQWRSRQPKPAAVVCDVAGQ